MLTQSAITDITAAIPEIETRAATPNMVRAYELGRRYAHINEWDVIDEMDSGDRDWYMDYVEDSHNIHISYLAGRAGTEMPSWVAGWRYGDAPQSGRSYNYADNYLEWGVSMMAVQGHDESQNLVSAIFVAAGREIRYYAGWLVTHAYGSDGEPLLVSCRAI